MTVTHHRASVNDTDLHYVTAGTSGTPILLVHGFPETWWAFRHLIPLLAERHRVVAVDLPGFGDSAVGEADSTTSAEDLHHLVQHLGLGPVHLLGQDISGTIVYRLAATHPADVRSLVAVESGLPGFGLEALADVTHGGTWYIGVLAAPGVAEMLLTGRESEFLSSIYSTMTASPVEVEEFARAYSRPGAWQGPSGLYRSMLAEGPSLRALSPELRVPVLAVGAGGGDFTASTFQQVAADVRTVSLDGVGHYVAQEAPAALATAIHDFLDLVDRSKRH